MLNLFKIVSKGNDCSWLDSRATLTEGKTYYGYIKDCWYYILLDNCRIVNYNDYYFNILFDVNTKELVDDKEFEMIQKLSLIKDNAYEEKLSIINSANCDITKKSITLFMAFNNIDVPNNKRLLLELVSKL